ncbi:MAG: hypothetical protein BJ554DRAFT_4196 [Olpidium bornovanus]|uniref:60S ribosomal protein L34 n=1 Tax=Olpidium bornovanus TaxID=278681 RepID=A0A8H8DEY8_9FUNG|nr:MAG: hypothetical protein BJ554DRAFT_4196 [Olpidium bornovanus]
MAQRLTYRRRLSYNTKSNRVRVVKTPGRRPGLSRRTPEAWDSGEKPPSESGGALWNLKRRLPAVGVVALAWRGRGRGMASAPADRQLAPRGFSFDPADHGRATLFLAPNTGGRLVYHHIKKPGTAPKCGDCGIKLPGQKDLTPPAVHALFCAVRSLPSGRTSTPRSLNARRLSSGLTAGPVAASASATGTFLICAAARRIVRAFLIEEQKIVKKVLKSQVMKSQKAGGKK